MTRLDAVPCVSGCEESIAAEMTTVMFQGMWPHTRIRGSHNVDSKDGGVPQRRPLCDVSVKLGSDHLALKL